MVASKQTRMPQKGGGGRVWQSVHRVYTASHAVEGSIHRQDRRCMDASSSSPAAFTVLYFARLMAEDERQTLCHSVP